MAPPLPRRTLFVDERGAGMRVTWHAERRFVVLSLWHGDVCAGSFRLPVDEAARLASFLVGHLGDLAAGAAPATDATTLRRLRPGGGGGGPAVCGPDADEADVATELDGR